jgi:hypothetical protein
MRGRLKGQQIHNLSKLLDMLYTPAELAEIIGFARRQVYRVYEHLGMPFVRDETGHIWINGVEFREWYLETYKKVSLGPNETYCRTCQRAVPIEDPQTLAKGGMVSLQSTCPNCGRKLSRFLNNLWRTSHDLTSEQKTG